MTEEKEKRPQSDYFGLGKQRYASDVEIIQALMKSRGHIARAAKDLGYTAGSLRQIISNSPLLKQAKDEIREQKLDEAESMLDTHIYEKESLTALLEYLKAVGKSRGYGSQSIDMYLEGRVDHKIDVTIIDSLLTKFESRLKANEANESNESKRTGPGNN